MPFVIQLEFLCLCLLNLTERYGKCLFFALDIISFKIFRFIVGSAVSVVSSNS